MQLTSSHETVKTRFCPSPTGLMHLGNCRTALFNALFALHAEGSFLLRIEDTDTERSDERYTEILMRDLQWLGLEWQEGPREDQGRGPYHQSQRQSIYDDYYHRLEKAGQAYPCFCSEEDLAWQRKVQLKSGQPPRYNGACRRLSNEEVAQKKAEGQAYTLRFYVPDEEVIEFEDLVRGQQVFLGKDIGDFIIRRTNGTSPFMFCNAVDDALMQVTHAFRGEDHLTNTPRQLMILSALGLKAPTYGHIALITGPDGSPLSKRHGSKSIRDLRQSGYLPIAILNYLARLGHYYGHDELLSLQALSAAFNVDALVKSPAKFNPAQLSFWQKLAVSHLDERGFWIWVNDRVKELVSEENKSAFYATVLHNIQFPADAQAWAECFFEDTLVLSESDQEQLSSVSPQYFQVALQSIEEHGADYQALIQSIKSNLGLKGKALFMPLRLALTGKTSGPELAQVMKLMPHSLLMKRLKNYANNL